MKRNRDTIRRLKDRERTPVIQLDDSGMLYLDIYERRYTVNEINNKRCKVETFVRNELVRVKERVIKKEKINKTKLCLAYANTMCEIEETRHKELLLKKADVLNEDDFTKALTSGLRCLQKLRDTEPVFVKVEGNQIIIYKEIILPEFYQCEDELFWLLKEKGKKVIVDENSDEYRYIKMNADIQFKPGFACDSRLLYRDDLLVYRSERIFKIKCKLNYKLYEEILGEIKRELEKN